MGLGNAITIYKSIQFIREGFNSLLQCKINVPLLDATSIGVSLISKELYDCKEYYDVTKYFLIC